MTIRPIIFSAPMVRALLEGRKTQTRRILSAEWQSKLEGHDKIKTWFAPQEVRKEGIPNVWAPSGIWAEKHGPCGYNRHLGFTPYRPGDLLYVREAFGECERCGYLNPRELINKPSNCASCDAYVSSFKPSIHMPRWASRLTLAVTDVRVQRLQCISDDDAVAEGARKFEDIPRAASVSWQLDPRWSMESPQTTDECLQAPKWAFANYWNKLHGPDAWAQNPWVVAVTFTVHKCNVDHFAGVGTKGAA